MATEMVLASNSQVELATAFLPVMSIQQAVQRYNAVLNFTKDLMKEGKDYGTIPGVDKPCLLKPGAEKLCSFFGLTPRFLVVKETERWDGDEPFFAYWYKCQLWRHDVLIAEGDGSCNSHESKYRYRWVGEEQIPDGLDKKRLLARGGRISEFDFSIEKAETTGKYGKPTAYWQAFKTAIANKTATRIQKKMKDGSRPGYEIDSTVYRVPNPDVADQVNTIQKMAQKRCLVSAVLIACNASEYYTQDIEEMDGITINVTATQVSSEPPQPVVVPEPQETPAPSSLDQILATFKSANAIAHAFATMRPHFVEIIDESAWDRVMAEKGINENAKKFGTYGNAKVAFKLLWDMYQQQLATIDAIPVEEEPPQ